MTKPELERIEEIRDGVKKLHMLKGAGNAPYDWVVELLTIIDRQEKELFERADAVRELVERLAHAQEVALERKIKIRELQSK